MTIIIVVVVVNFDTRPVMMIMWNDLFQLSIFSCSPSLVKKEVQMRFETSIVCEQQE
jgi:hypothetical protein